MIVVAGWLTVSPAERAAYLEGCATVVELARAAEGCLDFALSPDVVDDGRINIYERWASEAELLRFRGTGPDDEQSVAILDSSVRRYEISGEGPA